MSKSGTGCCWTFWHITLCFSTLSPMNAGRCHYSLSAILFWPFAVYSSAPMAVVHPLLIDLSQGDTDCKLSKHTVWHFAVFALWRPNPWSWCAICSELHNTKPGYLVLTEPSGHSFISFFILLAFIWVSWKDSCRIALVTCHTRAGTLKQARISVVWAWQSIHYITVTAWDSWTAALYYGHRSVTVRVAEVARIDARGNQTRDTLAKDRYRGRGDKTSHRLKLLEERWMELRLWTLLPPPPRPQTRYKLVQTNRLVGSLNNFLVNIISQPFVNYHNPKEPFQLL